jgi:hypothetical protein
MMSIALLRRTSCRSARPGLFYYGRREPADAWGAAVHLLWFVAGTVACIVVAYLNARWCRGAEGTGGRSFLIKP